MHTPYSSFKTCPKMFPEILEREPHQLCPASWELPQNELHNQ